MKRVSPPQGEGKGGGVLLEKTCPLQATKTVHKMFLPQEEGEGEGRGALHDMNYS